MAEVAGRLERYYHPYRTALTTAIDRLQQVCGTTVHLNAHSMKSSNFPLVLMFLQRYEPRAGIGTLTATMLPYTLVNAVVWPLLLIIWVLLGLSTGPGASLFYGA